MDKKTIGLRIRQLREQRRLTKRFLAKQFGISYSAMCKIEDGEFCPGDELKVRIANYFGTTVGKLFFDQENQ